MPTIHHVAPRRIMGGALPRWWALGSVVMATILPACGEESGHEDLGSGGASGGSGSSGGATGAMVPTGGGPAAVGGTSSGATLSGGASTTGGTGGIGHEAVDPSGGSGTTAGGTTSGSTTSGGTAAGGTAAGGTTAGGTTAGGTATGGVHSGGTATGLGHTGGAETGGLHSGGVDTGGTTTGLGHTGGADTGGTGAGGTETGAQVGGGGTSGAENGGGQLGGAGTAGAAAGDGGSAGAGGENAPVPSAGCQKAATLRSGTITLGGRDYILNIPSDYDDSHPYRLILGFHGANGRASDISGDYFGLLPLSNGSTIFIAANANGGLWSASTDVTYVDDILAQVTADLCIDTSRIMLEGFSQGAAMAWNIACSRPTVFRAMVGHSGGGVANPTTCEPIAYLGSLGLSDIGGNSQATQTDQFAGWNGCTIETLPTAPSGSHVCTNYDGCPGEAPVRWCSYDGGHTASPTDAGQSRSWMPEEVWSFVSQF